MNQFGMVHDVMYGQVWPAQSSNLIYEHIKHCWLSVYDYETSDLQACMTVLQLPKACKTSKFLSIEIKIQLQCILQMFA